MLERLHLLMLRFFRRLPVQLRRTIVRRVTPPHTVGAMVFLERADGSLLLVRHSYRSGWGVPGGLLERGETPREAAVRELREETRLEVEIVGEPAVVVDPDPRRVDVIFRARLRAGDGGDGAVASSPEIVDLEWFPADGLPQLQFETAQAMIALARSANSPQARPLRSVPPWLRSADAV